MRELSNLHGIEDLKKNGPHSCTSTVALELKKITG